MERCKRVNNIKMFEVVEGKKLLKENLRHIMKYAGPDLIRACFFTIGKWMDILEKHAVYKKEDQDQDQEEKEEGNVFEDIVRIFVKTISNLVIPPKSDNSIHEIFMCHVKEARNYQIIRLICKYTHKVFSLIYIL